jgi:signal transduction histidine kinase
LHNVVKHSGATNAVVELSHHGNRLTLCVSDSGCGFDLAAISHGSGLGLVSMRERLRPLGGQLTIETAPRAGTRVRAVIPIEVDAVAGDQFAERSA